MQANNNKNNIQQSLNKYVPGIAVILIMILWC
jgi:hypothetical protein